MKKSILSLLPVLFILITDPGVQAQCNAGFTWDQVGDTYQVQFTNTSTSEHDIISWQWTFGDGGTSDDQNPSHTYDEPGSYQVCLIIEDSEGCESDECHEVTVEGSAPDCEAGFTWDQIGGTYQVHFTNTSSSEFDIVSYQWNFGDGHFGDGQNPTHTYDEAGTYLVCLIIEDAEGCVSDVCHEVTVEAPQSDCNANFTWDQVGDTYAVHFTNTSTSEFDIISFQWNFGDGHSGDGANPTHTYDEPGTYLVCLIIEDSEGCVSDACHEVTVEGIESECHASFTWDQIGQTLEVDFLSTSTSDHDIISYQWNFGDGHFGDGNNPSHTYDEPGTYLVCLIIENEAGCVSDVCHEVTVEGVEGDCHASFTWEEGDNPLVIHFHSTSTSEHDIVSYQWTFGDGHSSDDQNPSHEYDEPGNYLVCLRIEDEFGCVSEICHEVTVEGDGSDCHASFTWEDGDNPLVIHFHSTSTSDHDIISYQWTFGDGHSSDDQNPSHEYDEPGTYLVCLRIEDASGCVSEICHEVTVEGMESGCHASFTWEQGGDNPLVIHFHSTSTSDHDIISYHWNFGDGHTSDDQNPSHEYDEPGTYLVCLIIVDAAGCASDVCHEVHVGEEEEDCHASFIWEAVENSLEIHFQSTSTSEHDIISYQWNFGDGHFGDGPNPHHTYEEPGTYVVCLRIEDNVGCVSEICHEVQVGESEEDCHASFTWEPGGDNPLVIHFHSTSTSDHDIISYQWTFGDGFGSDDQHPSHEYDVPGTYVVCLRIEDGAGCVSEICHEVQVGEQEEECNAAFNFETNDEGVVFFNNNSTGATDHTTWLWEFGDGESSTEENPQHDYAEPGNYVVCLFMIDTTTGCDDHYCHELSYELGWEEAHSYDEFNEFANSLVGSSRSPNPDLPIIRYTNPASDEISIEYFLDASANVWFELYDLTGYRLISRDSGLKAKGRQHEVLDIRNAHPGVYILTFTNGDKRLTMGVSITR